MNRLLKTGLLIGAGAWLYNEMRASQHRRLGRDTSQELTRWEDEGGALPDTTAVPSAAAGVPSARPAHAYPTSDVPF